MLIYNFFIYFYFLINFLDILKLKIIFDKDEMILSKSGKLKKMNKEFINTKKSNIILKKITSVIINGEEIEKRIVNLEVLYINKIEPLNSNWTVSWSSTDNYVGYNSFIGIFPFAEDINGWNRKSYITLDQNQNGIKQLKPPREAGIYDIRYIYDLSFHTIASTNYIIVNPSDIVINLSKNSISIGKTIKINYEFKGESLQITENSETFLCLNIIGSKDCHSTKLIKNPSGEEMIKIPKIAGYYTIKILIKIQTWKYKPEIKCLAISKLIKVSNPNFKLETKTNSIVASTAKVKWTVKNIKENDWIGFFNLNNKKFNFNKSVNPIDLIKIKNYKQGEFSAYIPPNNAAGPYIFIYFRDEIPIAISEIINMQQPSVKCLRNNHNNYKNIYDNNLLNFNPNFNPNFKTMSKIKYLVIICTENHSFDSYFGSYCKGEKNSKTCKNGPNCCEKPPETIQGHLPFILDDKQNQKYDPNHNQDCQRCQINGGRMDGFVQNCFCSDPKNFAIGDKKTMKKLHNFAKKYALADNYFQPSAGASCQNNMYLARADYVFLDNTRVPSGTIGSNCYYLDPDADPGKFIKYFDPTITHLLSHCGFKLKTYAEGYHNASLIFDDNPCYPDGFDASDIPFNYYAGVIDNPKYITDYKNFISDINNKNLADVSFIKPLGNKTGHPKIGSITDEINFIEETVESILNSEYSEDTLIIWVPDESGGYFDHVSPPKTNIVDRRPYGPRIPLLAMGNFAKKNYISHVEMEHSSIVKFIEWNWLSGETGQLNTRDTNVNSIGDLIDPFKAGVKIPN